MAFDILTWIIGYGFTKTTNSLVGKLFSKDLPNKLNKVVDNWAANLAPEFQVYPDAIFFYSKSRKTERPAMNALRNKLNSYSIPDENEWLNLLIEQWNYIKKTVENPQPLFTNEFKSIKPLLEDLAKKITIEIISDSKYFQNETLKRIKSIEKKIDWKNDAPTDIVSDPLIEPNEYFEFSNNLVRSIYIDPLTNRLHRQIRFRIRLKDNTSPIYNINLNLYLIVARLVYQPDNTSGYSMNWHTLDLKDRNNFIPKLSNYWSINYSIDPKLNDLESPFFKYKNPESIVDAKLRLFLNGETSKGRRVFAEWEYEWSKEKTIFGRFRLRELAEGKMTNELLNDIIEVENDSYEWPLFDIKKIGE